MPNLQPSNQATIERLFDSWQTIVNLISKYIKVPTAELLLCNDNNIKLICSSQTDEEKRENQNIYGVSIENAVNRLKNNVYHDNFVKGHVNKFGKSIWYCGLMIRIPQKKQFGMLFIADDHEHKLEELHYKLLKSYKLAIETQFKVEQQAVEINQLKLHAGLKFPNINNQYDVLTDALNQEIIKRKNIEEQLNYHRYYDTNTGFLNRFALEVELGKYFAQPKNDKALALIHIGFSNARNLQIRFGHKQWEMILTQYHRRLKMLNSSAEVQIARPNSTDLALLVCSNNLIHQVELICEQLTAINKSIFSIDNQVIHLHSYIGISTSDESISANEMLDYASTAMLSGRDSGAGYSYHSQALAESQSRLHQLENYLLQAVRDGDLMLYFQPKVCTKSRRWTGAEALLRWRHPILGEISTETLINMAEKNGLIFEVGNFVLKTAIEKASQWYQHINDFKMAVNVSAKQLKDVRFVEQVKQLLKEYQLPPQYLEIEVTESGLITDEKVASDILQILHELGVTISLDDFGTGYASFNYLKKFPFDCIKIDKSFIHPLEHSHDDREIVRSIIKVAKKLKLKVIIEGVETKEQEAFLIREGCDFGQGFLYGHPMSADDFESGLINQDSVFNVASTHH